MYQRFVPAGEIPLVNPFYQAVTDTKLQDTALRVLSSRLTIELVPKLIDYALKRMVLE
jgi:hypothetical protein